MPDSFVIPWTVACQAPLSMGFSRQEYWSRLPCPPRGDLPNPGIEPRSPALPGGFFTSKPPGKPQSRSLLVIYFIYSSVYMSGNQLILQYHAVSHHDEVITLSSSLRPHQVEKGVSLVVQWQRICLQCRRCWLDPWVRKIPWRRK